VLVATGADAPWSEVYEGFILPGELPEYPDLMEPPPE
jgi:hypothetical protein